ncbi:MAG TPA: PD-(D/E)XK nuclease family protein [Thermoanaerobaculia bacterium]
MAVQSFLPFDSEPAEGAAPPALLEDLARVCREHPLEEKILVAPTLAIGHQLAERLARSGTPWIGLRVETVRTLAHAVVGADLVREGLRVLSRAQSLALVEQACAEALGPRSYFGGLRDKPGLHRALQATLEELGAAGLDPERLPPGAFVDRQKHRELREVSRRHAAALEAVRGVDSLGILRRAVAALEAGGRSRRDAIFLLPAEHDLSPLSRRFLEALSGGGLRLVGRTDPEAWRVMAPRARFFRATGEENEIREIFRRILENGWRFDEVEILHTDPTVYPALLWELSREHDVPCTFSGGIAATFTRPGRAALAFLDWIGGDFAADVLRGALASGALALPAPSDQGVEPLSARAAASELREAAIGWGRDRHRRCLDRLVAELERPEIPRRGEEDPTPEQAARRRQRLARRLEAARGARALVRRALELAPRALEEPGDLPALARAAREFVGAYGRVADPLDASARTALDALFEELQALVLLRGTAAQAVERLRSAVAGLAIAPDRPRPGRVHVAGIREGGFSGRPHVFLAGLDEGRHPGRDLEDPILLDEERRRINETLAAPALALQRARPAETAAALKACLARLPGDLTASYSSFGLRNLSQAGEPAPSPFLLELFRERSRRPDADYADLARELPEAAGFVPSLGRALDDSERWLAVLRDSRGAEAAAGAVRAAYPWLEDGRRAREARESDELTVWDGWVKSGTRELDPRGDGGPISATRIQALATCPFAYFLRSVLRVERPEELRRDPGVWLEPMDEGSLLHDVFRALLAEITAAGEKPRFDRHFARLEEIANDRIAAWSEAKPPRSRVAFDEQKKSILFACRTFLRLEEIHCREVRPRHFEVGFGIGRLAGGGASAFSSPDPVEIALGGGRHFRLRGSIDRVDEAADGSFQVWDYKTGSTWSVREGAGLRGGRQIQPALYAMAFDTLLERAGIAGRVARTGYFFPGRKGEGRRIVHPIDPAEARDVLERLFDLLAAGLFPHATARDGCRHCDFEEICGGAAAAEQSERKLARSEHPALVAFREIHGEKKD